MSAPLNIEESSGTWRRFVIPGLFVVLLFGALIWRQGPEVFALQGQTMGTTYTVKIVGGGEGEKEGLAKAVRAALEGVDERMSTYKKSSELMKFNAAPTATDFPASPELVAILRDAKAISEATQGGFDVTVGPFVNAYGFGPNKDEKVPTDEELATLRERVGYPKIQISADGKTLRKSHDGMFVDLSSIAKGYGVDRAAEAIEAAGFKNYLVEVGGEVRTLGLNANGVPWKLGIETPVLGEGARRVKRTLGLSGQSLATSGDYRNYYEKDGIRISHTIDARTGRPIRHKAASVSVVHSNCTLADAWATALNVLGAEEGMKIAEEQKLAVLFIVRKGEEFVEIESSAFKQLNEKKK